MIRLAVLPVPLLAIAATVPAAPVTGAAAHRCAPRAPRAATDDGAAGFKRLGDLPPASELLLVDRTVGGCPAPLVVRTGIGGTRVGAAPHR